MSDRGVQVEDRTRQDNRLCRLIDEVELLLSHLQRLPETRLTRYFGKEARQRQAREDTPVPPTWDQVYFLDRLAAILASGQPNGFTDPFSKGVNAPPIPAPPRREAVLETAAGEGPGGKQAAEGEILLDPGPKLNDLAFLFWSRDFLAAITYPASVESIRVTRAFRTARARPFWRTLVSRLRRTRGGASHPADEDILGDDKETLRQYGVKLAKRIRFLSFATAGIIFVSVWVSFMVFSGRVLIRENDALQAARKDLVQRISLAEKDERRELVQAFHHVGGPEASQPAWYCDLSLPPGTPAPSAVRSKTAVSHPAIWTIG